MKKRTIVEQIEIKPDGHIQIRIGLDIVDDDGTVYASQWHRTILPPGHDIDRQMAMTSDAIVRDLKHPPIEAECIARIKAHASVAWKPHVVAAHRMKVAAQEAFLAEKRARETLQ